MSERKRELDPARPGWESTPPATSHARSVKALLIGIGVLITLAVVALLVLLVTGVPVRSVVHLPGPLPVRSIGAGVPFAIGGWG